MKKTCVILMVLVNTCSSLHAQNSTVIRKSTHVYREPSGNAGTSSVTPDEPTSRSVAGTRTYNNQGYSLTTTSEWLKKEWISHPTNYITTFLFYNKRKEVLTVVSDNTGFTNQRYVDGTKGLPVDSVEKYADQDFRMTGIGVDATGGYRILMTKNTGLGSQVATICDSFPSAYIQEFWDKDYYITAITSDPKKRWSVIMSKGTNYESQSYLSGSLFPKDLYKEKYDKGFRINAIHNDGLSWYVVMSTKTGYSEQVYNNSSGWPDEWIKAKWDQGYYITSIAEKNGFLVVMSKFAQ